jgi:hypothetical protein
MQMKNKRTLISIEVPASQALQQECEVDSCFVFSPVGDIALSEK